MKSIFELSVVFVSGFLLGVIVMGNGQARLTRVQRIYGLKDGRH